MGCRVDMMVVCEPGVYSLRTGAGPLGNDPDCGSSHCEILTQDNLATLIVVSAIPLHHEFCTFSMPSNVLLPLNSLHVRCCAEQLVRAWDRA